MVPPSQPSWSPVDTVILRNNYYVDRKGDTFRVSSTNERGGGFAQEVEGAVLRYLSRECEGQTLTVEEAEEFLARSGLDLPYSYGHKLHFFAQTVLVALVASGQASHAKSGRRFVYHLA